MGKKTFGEHFARHHANRVEKARRKIEDVSNEDYHVAMIKCRNETEAEFKERKDAVLLLREVVRRLASNREDKLDILIGGAYWRLAKVLSFVDDRMCEREGVDHAEFVRRTHGRLVK